MFTRILCTVFILILGIHAANAGVLVYDEGNSALDSEALSRMLIEDQSGETPVVESATDSMEMCNLGGAVYSHVFPATSSEASFFLPKVICERVRLANCRLPRSPCLGGLLKPA